MPNPQLPGIAEKEQALLYDKLRDYNRGRASFKEAGIYLIVLPRPGKPNYSLWLYVPSTSHHPFLYINELSPDVYESLRIAGTMLYYSRRCIAVMPYNEKRMRSRGDDIIFFGKYRGHFLHEILQIDPGYLAWIAYRFSPDIPKHERFVQMARAYHTVHLDVMLRKNKQRKAQGGYMGQAGGRLEKKTLRILSVRIDDDPYRTVFRQGAARFYVRQFLVLHDAEGNLATITVRSKRPSPTSGVLPAFEHAYRSGEILHVASARIARLYESRGRKYTHLSHVKFSPSPDAGEIGLP